ncbi:glycosyltransferase [Glaciimonas sp. Gout2]|uniref:glycosyltransferase n=2 Tax=unclassified Glaciimonas TaxID=2644401 RepID=UPI002B2397D6|nr:glycosyltransferase [Glaciimonas sp. Gout2]
MRLIFICNEAPYPANHGGRVDVWRRLCALKAAGVEIFLVFWSGDRRDEMPTEWALGAMREQVSGLNFYVIERSIFQRIIRLLRLFRWPSHVASRVLAAKDRAELLTLIQAFKPDAVWLESIYGGILASEVADAEDIPMVCRSHNIEHLYMRRQVAKATSLRDRLVWGLNLLHLHNFELATLRHATRFFDISIDDLRFWKDAGMNNGEWLPPMVDPIFAARLSSPREEEPNFDVGYLGNLFAPNNVDGVMWLLEEVIGRLRAVRPTLRIFIAGSRPVEKIIAAAHKHGVCLIMDPDDVVPILRDARVLVNPVFSGSGVNVKSVEMLFSPSQLVSTTQGLTGLPAEVTRHFRCADTPEDFSTQVLEALDAPDNDFTADRDAAREKFSSSRAEQLVRSMREYIKQHEKSGACA